MTKYTFAIVPFRFQHDLKDMGHSVREMGFWKESNVSYNRLYSHATHILDKNSAMWGAEEYLFDFAKARRSDDVIVRNKCTYVADYMVKGIKHSTPLLINKIKLFLFETKIGFAVINIDFTANISFDEMCAACSALKILRKSNSDSGDYYLNIKSVTENEEHSLNLHSMLERILPSCCSLSFERNSKSDPSAIMLSSFLFEGELTDDEAASCLQVLKRAQTKEHNNVTSKASMIHPFQNMYWDFSPQGVANINYIGDYSGKDSFFNRFSSNVEKEYLYMTILLLHQEYTLLDYCQCLSQVDADSNLEERLEMMYEFKMKYITSAISHLENYRDFFHRLRAALDIDEMLEEVEMKLQAMHSHISQIQMAEQLAIDKENARRQQEMDDLQKKYMDEEEERKERINTVITLLSVVLSMFSIAALVSDSVQAISILGGGRFILYVFLVVLALAAIIIAVYFAFPILKGIFVKSHKDKTRDD